MFTIGMARLNGAGGIGRLQRTTQSRSMVGKGQITEGDDASAHAQGKINEFTTSGTLDFVEGDATTAYGGALTSAIRRVWYLRGENALLVWDRLSRL